MTSIGHVRALTRQTGVRDPEGRARRASLEAWTRLRTTRPAVMLSALFLGFLLVAAAFPHALTGADPLATDPYRTFAAPSWHHPFGTDENGRDVWARFLYGTRPSLLLGVLAALITVATGVLIGLAAGLGPRLVGGTLMRLVDVLQSVPQLLLALLIVSFWGASPATLLVSLGVAGVPARARQMRAQVLLLRRAPFVEAARTLGLPTRLVILRHVLPNAVKPVLVLLPLEIGWKIAIVATLSFLGVGAPPPAPLWGAMLAVDRDFVLNGWWLTAIPALLITLTVIAINTLGRELVGRPVARL